MQLPAAGFIFLPLNYWLSLGAEAGHSIWSTLGNVAICTFAAVCLNAFCHALTLVSSGLSGLTRHHPVKLNGGLQQECFIWKHPNEGRGNYYMIDEALLGIT
jgi:hypothetical protein